MKSWKWICNFYKTIQSLDYLYLTWCGTSFFQPPGIVELCLWHSSALWRTYWVRVVWEMHNCMTKWLKYRFISSTCTAFFYCVFTKNTVSIEDEFLMLSPVSLYINHMVHSWWQFQRHWTHLRVSQPCLFGRTWTSDSNAQGLVLFFLLNKAGILQTCLLQEPVPSLHIQVARGKSALDGYDSINQYGENKQGFFTYSG